MAFSTSVRIGSARCRSSASAVTSASTRSIAATMLVVRHARAVAVGGRRPVGAQQLPRVLAEQRAGRLGPARRARFRGGRRGALPLPAAAAGAAGGRGPRPRSRARARAPCAGAPPAAGPPASAAERRLEAADASAAAFAGMPDEHEEDDRGGEHDPDRRARARSAAPAARAGPRARRRHDAGQPNRRASLTPEPAPTRAARRARRRARRPPRPSSTAPAHGG